VSANIGSESLCQSCGLCCDGTLFGKVRLQPADNAALLRSFGIVILAEDKKEFFTEPCACYRCERCEIYRDRPKACVDFRCDLLRSYDRNEVSYEQARAIIQETLERRDGIRADLKSLPGGCQSVRDLYSYFSGRRDASDPVSSSEQKRILLDCITFIHGLRRYFGFKDETKTHDG
jgi:hypothetical protein